MRVMDFDQIEPTPINIVKIYKTAHLFWPSPLGPVTLSGDEALGHGQ